MNVAQSIQALRENEENLPDPLPLNLLTWAIPRVVAMLRDPEPEVEELQNRSNQEWEDLLKEESEPREAGLLLLEWLKDKAQAREKLAGYEEEEGLPDSYRLSR